MVYEYECEKCSGYFEITMSLAEYEKKRDKVPCPKCPDIKLKRIITKPVNFELKGHGWENMGYSITDMEMRTNNESDARLGDVAEKQMGKQTNISEV